MRDGRLILQDICKFENHLIRDGRLIFTRYK